MRLQTNVNVPPSRHVKGSFVVNLGLVDVTSVSPTSTSSSGSHCSARLRATAGSVPLATRCAYSSTLKNGITAR